MPEPEWEVYLLDVDGFVLPDPEVLIDHIADPDWIDHNYGDCQPVEIVVARGSAKPRAQYEDAEPPLRAPSSYRTVDHFVFEVEHEDPERALLLWRGAQGFVAALNGQLS